MNEGHFVGHATKGPDRVAEHFAALAIRPEGERRLHPGPQAVLECFDRFAEVRGCAVVFFESRFVVEEVDMAGCPGHEELDHPLGPWAVVQLAREHAGIVGCGKPLCVQQVRQGDAAEAPAGLPEEVSARRGAGRRVGGRCWGGNGHSTNTNSLRLSISRQAFGSPWRRE